MNKVLYIGQEEVYADFFKSCCPPFVRFQHWNVRLEELSIMEFLKESGSLILLENYKPEIIIPIKDRLLSCRHSCTFCAFASKNQHEANWEHLGIKHVFLRHWPKEKIEQCFLKVLGFEYPIQPGIEISQREREVLQLIADGFSTLEMADELHISVHTINTHRKALLKKFQAKTPADLIVKAIKYKILENLG